MNNSQTLHQSTPHMIGMIIRLIFQDGWFKTGCIGSIIMLAANWIVEFLSPFVGLLAACGGVIVVVMTIWQKTIEITMLKRKERKEEQEEEKINNK